MIRLCFSFRHSVSFIACILLMVTGSTTEVEGIEFYPSSVRVIEDSSAGRQTPSLARVASRMLLQTNHFRREHGLTPVYSHPDLVAAAEYFANYMARTNKYGHTADGQSPSERAGRYGYDYCIITENIASQQSSRVLTAAQLANGFIEGWKRSDAHRKNILDPDVIDLGVAVAYNEETDTYFAVQMFGRPRHEAIEFSISNQTAFELEYRVEQRSSDKHFYLAPGATSLHRQCRSSQIQLTLPAQKQLTAVRHGLHFIVHERQDGTLQIRKQSLEERR